MKTQNNLLNKYYKGETSLEEERSLKDELLSKDAASVEKDVFSFYRKESRIPENLEDELFSAIETKQKHRKAIKIWLSRIAASAAVLLLLITIFAGIRHQKNIRIENQFLVMEQALFQVSESIQPHEQEEILVLWVDNDVEIIIN